MHAHGHEHSHHHDELPRKKLGIAIVLNVGITLAQAIGGLLSGSLSLLSDALHNLSDVISLSISYLANKLSKKKASASNTFGYQRAEVIAAFVNAATLVVIAIVLIIEAVRRFFDPKPVESDLVIWLALVAILGNAFSVILLRSSRKGNMNMKSAYLHLLSDMLASVAVLIGGLVMKYFGYFWVDPLLTLLISIYLIYVSTSLLKQSTQVLMLHTPGSINIDDIVETVTKFEKVKNVHHIHVWQLHEKDIHFEAHIEFYEDLRLSEFEHLLERIEETLQKKHGVGHVNLQPEFERCDDKEIIVQH